jgi:proton-translocating NADH-quinone oxidoreductase chain M
MWVNSFLNNLLLFLIITPIIGILFLLFISNNNSKLIKKIALFFSLVSFILSLLMWIFFDNIYIRYQFVYDFNWISLANLELSFGVDGISIFFILLSTFLIPICLLGSWVTVNKNPKFYYIAFLSIEFFLILVFSVRDILFFYIFFESILIPMFIIIGIWGSRERKIRASYLFFLYTLFGSLLMLLSIIYIYYIIGTTEYETILMFNFNFFEQKLIWLSFFISFAAKVPMLPVHIWLPEAHVEAPTAGSVLLAGILLKLGTYGFIRFSLPLFYKASIYFTPFIFSLSILGIIYTSFTAIRQTDLKRIIAYTSVAHMNLVVIGIFSFNVIGLEGALLQSLSHGFVSSALFLIIGVVYDRYHTRLVVYYSGLAHTMPLFSLIFLFFTMANIALPGTSSFVGEFLIFIGIFKISTIITFLSAISMILGGAYSLWLLNRVIYGNLKIQYIKNYEDLNSRELLLFIPLIFSTFFIGIFPEIFLGSLHGSCLNLISYLYIN